MKLFTITRATELDNAVKAEQAMKFGTRLDRMNAEVVYNYYVLGMEKKNFKSMTIVFDYTSELVSKIVKNFEDSSYTLTFKNGETRNVKSNELLSVYSGVKVVAEKVKPVVKPTDNMSFAIATVRKSNKGNDRFLHKTGKFGCSYANRYIYNTVKGAESLIARIYRENGMKLNTLKVVSA